MLTTYEQSVEEISRSIFSTMLEIELTRAEQPLLESAASLQAAIHIAGVWTGCVVITLSDEVAHTSAANMLGVPKASVCEDDVKDTVTELANMVGGNLKSVLPGPSFLSLPSMVGSEESGLRSSGVDIVDDVWFVCEYGPVRIRVFQKRLE